MEKVAGDTAAIAASDLSPRSTLCWNDAWVYESAGVDSKKSEHLPMRISQTRSNSLVGLSSDVTSEGPQTSHRLERRLFRRLLPSPSPDRQVSGSCVISNSHSVREGPPSPVLWALSSPTLQLQIAVGDRGHRAQPYEVSYEVWETVWADSDIRIEVSPRFSGQSSASCTSGRDDDEDSIDIGGDEKWNVDYSGSSTLAPPAKKETPRNQISFLTLLNEELSSIEDCMRRAINLGTKVRHHGALEVSQLRGEKEKAEASVQKSEHLNLELQNQVCTLRDQIQKLQRERELEVMAVNKEIQELTIERNALMKAARDEKRTREKLQNEVDSILTVLLKQKMQLESERESYDTALLNEKKKLYAMRKARDAAAKALEDGNTKLKVERDAMLSAMHDLTSRLDFERDAKLSSMRRTSMDMATMMSNLLPGERSSRSISMNDTAPYSLSRSRRNSRQYE